MRRQLAAAISGAVVLGAAPGASARDIFLTLPVTVSNMPAGVTAVYVSCTLTSTAGRRVGPQGIRLPLNGGAWRGNVTFQFIPSGYVPGDDPTGDFGSYVCSYDFRYVCTAETGGIAECSTPAGAVMAAGAPGARLFTPAPGAETTGTVEGRFSRADAERLPRRAWQ
jgi:hypothetical protein